jgi:hypothetical protein
MKPAIRSGSVITLHITSENRFATPPVTPNAGGER